MTDLFDDILTPAITEFKGEHDFLSNFFVAAFVWDGSVWPSSEHAYQAAKSLDPDVQRRIRNMPSPGATKRAGKLVAIRPDWEQVKVSIMLEIVLAKFTQNPDLKDRLLDTGDAHLEEGNWWGDRFWGVSPARSGTGRNELGKILMDVREVLRQHA